MIERKDEADDKNAQESPGLPKKVYQEPAFRHERVFETMALSCGKLDTTEAQCKFHRNAS